MKEGDCICCRIGEGLTRTGIAPYGFFDECVAFKAFVGWS